MKSNCFLTLVPTLVSHFGVIRVKMFALKNWVFLADIWNFNKWKSLIIDDKYWIIWKAMLKKTTKVISTVIKFKGKSSTLRKVERSGLEC